ncbi:Coiled-coil and C2 domain-containing protein 2A [Borealophlyctis nickersoniae]|nr:Coiled-coil and C2 domain-containing protein 2A [Borealophlyctis nickersoniae]
MEMYQRRRGRSLQSRILLDAPPVEEDHKKKDDTKAAAESTATESDTSSKKEGKKKKKKRAKKGKKKRRDSEVEEEKGSDEDDEFKRLVDKANEELVETYVGIKKWEKVWNEMCEAEGKILCHPEDFTFDMLKGVGGSWEEMVHNIRFLEDEGLYVNELPPVTEYNRRKMECRIMMTERKGGKSWFDPSHHLLNHSSPLDQPTRPPPVEPLPLSLHKPHTLPPFRPVPSPSGTYTLTLTLLTLRIDEHPLMIEEIRLAREVEALVGVLRERKRSAVVEFLEGRVEALRQAYASLPPLSNGTEREVDSDGIYPAKPVTAYTPHLTDYDQLSRDEREREDWERRWNALNEIRAARELRDTESQTDRLLEFKILKAWDRIKDLRSSSGFAATDVRVVVKAKEADANEDARTLHTLVHTELSDLRDAHSLTQTRLNREHTRAVAEFQSRRAAREAAREERKRKREVERKKSDDEGFGTGGESEESLDAEAEAEGAAEKKEGPGKVKGKNGKGKEGKSKRIKGGKDKKEKKEKKEKTQDEELQEREAHAGEEPKGGEEGKKKKDKKHKKEKKRKGSTTGDTTEAEGLKTSDAVRTRASRSPSILSRMRRRSPSALSATAPPETDSQAGPEAEPKFPAKHTSKKTKRSRRKPKRSIRGDTSEDSEEDEEVEPVMPELPEFNGKKEKSSIKKRLESCRRPVGAPLLSIACVRTCAVTPGDDCPRPEHLRRRELQATRIHAHIFYNDKQVTTAPASEINPVTYEAVFRGDAQEKKESAKKGAVMVVQVREIPESLRVELYEATPFGDSLLGETFIPIPSPTETTAVTDREPTTLQFVGRPFSDQMHPEVRKWVSGTVRVLAAWAVDPEGKSLGPQVSEKGSKDGQPAAVAGTAGPDWIEDVRLDPNDPRNQDLLHLKHLVRAASDSSLPAGGTFREHWAAAKFFRIGLPKWMEEAALGVGLDFPMAGKRLDLLRARCDKDVVVQQPVPLRDEEITEGMYHRVADPLKDDEIASSLWGPRRRPLSTASTPTLHLPTPASLPHDPGFLKRIRSHQLLSRARLSRPPRVDDYVREERLPETQPRQFLFFNLVRPRRPLKPYRTDRAAAMPTAHPGSCRVVVQVLRGFNVPVRKRDAGIVDAAAENAEEPVTVRPYVEVTFQRRRTRTAISEGPNPQWNETLYLDVEAPGDDFRPESLLDSEVGVENMYFNLFDEYFVDMIQDDRDREHAGKLSFQNGSQSCFLAVS